MQKPMGLMIVVLGCASLTLAVHARQGTGPQATFRSSVDLVDVDVSVLDKDRLPVLGLTAEDFTVLEDGKPRPIAAFTPVELAPRISPTAPWLDDIAPDVATNRFPPAGRLIVILMDRSITTEQRPVARAIGEAVIAQMRPGDLAAVVFSTHGIPQNFTDDRQRLLAAVQRPFLTLPRGDSGGAGDCYCGSCTLETIANVAEGMREVRQRRKILITVGSNISIAPMGNCAGALNNVRARAFRAIQAGNVTVHAFDTQGVDPLTPPSGQPATPDAYARMVQASLRRRGNLGVLPGETGGRVVSGNAPAMSVSAVVRESTAYYVLGFQPASSATDGRFHDIKVKVNRRDVTVQARQGYFAPGGKPAVVPTAKGVPPTLAAAVAGVWPKTDLNLTMQAVPFAAMGLQSTELSLAFAVHYDVDEGERPSGPATQAATPVAARAVDLFVGAFDRNGKSLSDTRQAVTVTPRSVGGRGIEYELRTRLKLKPGRYEIRAAIDDRSVQASGSVYGYVDVPDFAAEFVTLSGIVLQSTAPGATPPAIGADDLVPLVPTARREFSKDARVLAFVRENQGLRRAVTPGYLDIRILDANDRRVYGQEHRVLPSAFGVNRAMDYAFELPLTDLAPGEYLLTVEARHGNAIVKRDLRFGVAGGVGSDLAFRSADNRSFPFSRPLTTAVSISR